MPEAAIMMVDHALKDDWMIADIGATNSRFAVCTAAASQIRNTRLYKNDDFKSIDELAGRYLGALQKIPAHAVIAIAAPVSGDDVRMINRDWIFNRVALAGSIGIHSLRIINDFHALAWALPGMTESSRVEIGRSKQYRSGNIAVLGPGSGLGVSAWIRNGEDGTAMSGEGGHVTLAARNSDEEAVIQHFRALHGHCSAERVLCGPGLLELHFALHGERLEAPEVITSNAREPRCNATLQQFFLFLGSVAADLALTTGAFGGLYLAGSIVPACIETLRHSGFRDRFDDKNRYREYMQSIPTWVITDPSPGLTGLVAYVRNFADT